MKLPHSAGTGSRYRRWKVLTLRFGVALTGTCLLFLFQATNASENLVRMEVRNVTIDPIHQTPVVILIGGHRLLPIWIGMSEARAIARALTGEHLSRPGSHDLISDLLSSLDAKPERVTITELRDNTFFATITVKTAQRRIILDSRPSDAIALALRNATPIYATVKALERSVGLNDSTMRQRDSATLILGMHVQDLTTELATLLPTRRQEGVLVAHVERDSTASRLGVQRGDLIIGVDLHDVTNTRELKKVLDTGQATRPQTLHIQRDGKLIALTTNSPSQKQP